MSCSPNEIAKNEFRVFTIILLLRASQQPILNTKTATLFQDFFIKIIIMK